MDIQDFLSIQEAYMEVYEEKGDIKDRDEKASKQKADARMVGAKQLAAHQFGIGAISKDENEQRLNTLKKTIDKGMEKRKEKVRNRNLTFSRTKGDDALKIGKSPKTQKEETDIYDIILSHLLDEGYADTQEAAEAIMVNMSEEWRESICEGLGGAKNQGDYDEMERKRKEVRDEHLRKYKSEELPFQKQKKADQAQDFLKKYPKKKK
jgi:hypothetical protein